VINQHIDEVTTYLSYAQLHLYSCAKDANSSDKFTSICHKMLEATVISLTWASR